MLARLAELEGVRHAETDRTGNLLRLSVDSERARGSALELLTSLGYAAEPAPETQAVRDWYDANSVGELSLIEAGVIVDRVLPQLVQTRTVEVRVIAALRAALVDALHRCFLTNALGPTTASGTFRDECVRVSVAAAVPLIGTAGADALGRVVDADMHEVHREEPA